MGGLGIVAEPRRATHEHFQRIKQDHGAAREVIEKLKATTPRARKQRYEFFDHLKIDMWVHHKVGEALFYSHLRAGKEMHGGAMEAYCEHHMASGAFEELNTFPVDSEERGMKFKALCELVEHHMKQEERDFFPVAKKVLSKEESLLTGERFDKRKRVVMAALQPPDVKRDLANLTKVEPSFERLLGSACDHLQTSLSSALAVRPSGHINLSPTSVARATSTPSSA